MSLLATSLALLCSAQDPAPVAAPPVLGIETWSGYLFRDGEGRVHVGWPVVAMGVMARAAHTLEPKLAERLAPLVSAVDDDHFFWNYALEKSGEIAASAFPRALVTLRGDVAGEAPPAHGAFGSQGFPKEMRSARVQEVELLDPAWLAEWALFFRDPASPFRVAAKSTSTREDRAAFAPAALAALRRMRALPGPSAERSAEARRIEATVVLSERFRRITEMNIQRWLVESAARGELSSSELADLPPLPPSSTEIQGLFLAAEDLAGFLAAVKQRWSGDPALLSLVHYETNGSSTWHQTTPLDAVPAWSAEQFARCRAATRDTLKR
jgi:hypothetical protein